MAVKANGLASRYTRAAYPIRPRTIARSVGEVGAGKTRWWLNAPGPIVVQSFDKGLEGVIEEFQDGKEIYPIEYDWRPVVGTTSEQEAQTLRAQFEEDYRFALKHARTVVWDKETSVWQLYRYAEFGGPSDKPKDYDALNLRYMNLINEAKEVDVNFALIQGMKDKWGTKKVTNQQGQQKEQPFQTDDREAAGFRRLDELVFMEINHRCELTDEGPRWTLELGKCRQNKSMQYQSYDVTEGSGLSFAEFGQLLIEGSEQGDWE